MICYVLHVVGEKFEELEVKSGRKTTIFSLGQLEICQLTPPELCLRFNYFDAFFLQEGANLLLQSQRLHGRSSEVTLRFADVCMLFPARCCFRWMRAPAPGYKLTIENLYNPDCSRVAAQEDRRNRAFCDAEDIHVSGSPTQGSPT